MIHDKNSHLNDGLNTENSDEQSPDSDEQSPDSDE